jgi:threonyl-tRNA synthetase
MQVGRLGSTLVLLDGPLEHAAPTVGAVRLVSLAGAYWRGDPAGPQLTRIHGLAAPTEEALVARIAEREEANRRDHRVLGRELDLFLFHPYAPGAPFWLPRGLVMWNILSQRMREHLLGEGYLEVRTPILFDQALWETSGHWENYRDNMFIVPTGDRAVSLKPMNCPSHMLLFASRTRSFRDLPLRLHDQSILHRNEVSGALGGLTRLRQFSQDDAHIFLRSDQIQEEVLRLLEMVDRVYRFFGFPYTVKLSTRPVNSLGDAALWERAEESLAAALRQRKMTYSVNAGDGAFYGPKIDVDVTDAIGRKWQVATVQLDFNLPQRFKLRYVDEDGSEQMPVVIHRAIYGSLERFLGILLEHYAGNLPVWLAPEQARIVPINAKVLPFAMSAAEALRKRGLRVEVDDANDTLGAKIRRAEVMKIPYVLVVGEREAEAGGLNVRKREPGGKSLTMGVLAIDAVGDRLVQEAAVQF